MRQSIWPYNVIDQLSNGRITTDYAFSSDSDGLVSFIYPRKTGDILYGNAEVTDSNTFRILLIRPHNQQKRGINQRTGQFEISEEIGSCQYWVGEVSVETSNSPEAVIRSAEEQLRTVINNPTNAGQVTGDRGLNRIYEQFFSS